MTPDKAKSTLEDMPAVMPCDVCGTDVDISDAIRVVRARRAFCYDHQSHYPYRATDTLTIDELMEAVEDYNRAHPATEITAYLKEKS